MKTIFLYLYVGLTFFSIAQSKPFPYFVPKEQDVMRTDYVYLLEKDENQLKILKLNEGNRYELIVYYSGGPLLVDYYRGNFLDYDRFRILENYEKNFQIIQNDSLIFALDKGSLTKYRYDDSDFDFDLSRFNDLIFKNGNFYSNKFNAFFERKPVISPTLDSIYQRDWFVSLQTGNPIIKGKCSETDDLDCLCAALTHNTSNQREKSDEIAKFIIDRLNYNRGDTAQTNVKGLVFGKEREAVCEGYSRVYVDLMTRAEVPVKYASGAVRTDVYDIFYSGHSHAWNEVVLDGKPYVLDVTWSDDIYSEWYLKSPDEMFVSHFNDEKNDSSWAIQQTKTMYDFMNQPLIIDLERGGMNQLTHIDKSEPVQFAKDKFVLKFSKPMKVINARKQGLSFPFVRFQGEANEISSKPIAKEGKVVQSIKTTSLEVQLPERFNNLSVDIEGIGTIKYIVYNGTEQEFYQFFVDNIDVNSAYSVGMAFLSCAKLKDEALFKKLKPYIANQKLTFKVFMKQAKEHNITDFKYAVYSACRHMGSFDGYSFQFSKNGEKDRIFLKVDDVTKKYSFAKFDQDTWSFDFNF
jgi:hypothetical protein